MTKLELVAQDGLLLPAGALPPAPIIKPVDAIAINLEIPVAANGKVVAESNERGIQYVEFRIDAGVLVPGMNYLIVEQPLTEEVA